MLSVSVRMMVVVGVCRDSQSGGICLVVVSGAIVSCLLESYKVYGMPGVIRGTVPPADRP